MSFPQEGDYAPYYQPYIDQVQKLDETNVMLLLDDMHDKTQQFLRGISEKKGNYRYAEGKWSIKELVQHLVDSERVFNYRALRWSRNDTTDLPGFDHDAYVPESGVEDRTLEDIIDDFEATRVSTISLFLSFTNEMWKRGGTGNGQHMTVNALAWVILGHEMHHMNILKERYLN